MPQRERGTPDRRVAHGVLATVFLFTLAIAQPVLDLVGRNPEFLVAHDTSPAGVVGMAVLLAVGLPLAIGLMVAAIRKVLPRLGTALHVTVISVLMGLLLMRMAKAIEVLPDLIVVALALLLGVVGGVAITYVQAARQAAAWGAAASILAVGMFLIATPARSLLQSYDHEAVPALGVPEGDLPPVVMVVFDEFALTSLLDPAGELDTALYPSFGRLARDATFYRNTVAVHSNTTQVIPAMLTAQHVPSGPALPTAVKHPVNAFSILAPSYDIRVTEPVTSLCPSDVCDSPAGSGAAASTMVVDVWFIALHVLLPDGFTRSLPPVDQGWGDFAAEPTQEDLAKRFAVASRKHRGKTFMSAVRAIEPASDRPTFDFVHTLLPHVPWDFLSTGQTYGAPRTVFGMGENKAWGTNDWLVQQAHQRYMLQVGYVDRLVGALIDELEREGVYNETLLIVTADHGVSFVPGFSRRHFLPETVGGSAWFPLFVKLPQQRDGGTDDRPLTSIDVLPTIIAAIGGDLGEYDFEGVEAGQVTTERRDRTVPGSPSWPEFDEAKRDARKSVV